MCARGGDSSLPLSIHHRFHFDTTPEESDEENVENENVDEEDEKNDLLWIISLSMVVFLLGMALVASYFAF